MRATSSPALLLGSDVGCARLHVKPPSCDDAAGGGEMGLSTTILGTTSEKADETCAMRIEAEGRTTHDVDILLRTITSGA